MLSLLYVICVFCPVGSLTSFCARLGPQLAFLTSYEFISVRAHKLSSSKCGPVSIARPFSTSFPCSLPISVIFPLLFFKAVTICEGKEWFWPMGC